jgi:hypothetical protein
MFLRLGHVHAHVTPPQYAATYSNAFKNICAIYKLLIHFNKQYLPFFSKFGKCYSYILANINYI